MAGSDRPQTGALTGVFAPGSPSLLETLRTLAISPRRRVAPGETIRVEFAFSNLGGAPATNVRVRLAIPSGVTYVEGAGTVDGQPLPEGERFVTMEGAALGDLPANAQRRIACSFRVHDRVEDGTELRFQAALVTDQTPVLASNVERVIVRSQPVLHNSSTFVTIAGPEHPKPGDTIVVRATIANTGASSAHDVLAFFPVPEHTRYIERSARVGGRVLLDVPDEPFDYNGETVVTERLAPGQSVVLEYQAAIEAPLPDGTRIKVAGAVSARDAAEFAVQSSEIVVSSPPDFATEDTALTVFSDDVVTPGTRIPLTLRATNAGTGDAQGVSIAFDLPQGLIYTPGSARVDGQPVSDETFAGNAFSLGNVPAGRVVDAGISAIVAVQDEDDFALPVTATLRWKGGERRFSRMLRMRVGSRFTRARNFVEVDRSSAAAREDVTFTAHVFNDGTAPASGVRLRVIRGAFLEDVRIAESPDEPVPYAEPFDVGIVQPHSERTFTIRARVASPVPDRSQVTLGAVLEYGSATHDLGVATVVLRSRPQVSPPSCTWERVQMHPMRPGQTGEIVIRFTNDGSDVLRGAQMQLTVPPEIVLERAENAQRDGATLRFGDVPAESTHEARVTIRLARAPKGDRTLTLEGTLSGRGISSMRLAPLDVETFAQAQFEEGAELRANPSETINAGERVAYEIHLQNTGDGIAERVSVRAVPCNLAVYVPSSTTLNGVTIPDDLGTSQLWSQRGLLLADVNPGVELRVRWEMVVIAPLAAGTPVETHAVVEWDPDRSLALSAPVLRVVSTPSLEAGSAGTPISVAQMLPPLELPAFEPVEPPVVAPEPVAPQEASQPEAPRVEQPVLYTDFSRERLEQAVRALERSDGGGLIPHVFAMRTLFPDAVAGATPELSQTVSNAAVAVRAPLERFFVRLSAPRVEISSKDLEDRESRLALRELVDALLNAPSAALSERGEGIVRLSGAVDVEALRGRAAELNDAPIGSVLPWIVSAQLMGTEIDYGSERSEALGAYRAELLKVFGVLETLPMAEFHRVLGSSVNRTLDDALAAVLEVLRASARVPAS